MKKEDKHPEIHVQDQELISCPCCGGDVFCKLENVGNDILTCLYCGAGLGVSIINGKMHLEEVQPY